MRQLGYDISATQITRKMGFSNSIAAEPQFVGKGKKHIVSKFQKIFWVDAARVGVRTSGGSIY